MGENSFVQKELKADGEDPGREARIRQAVDYHASQDANPTLEAVHDLPVRRTVEEDPGGEVIG